MCSVGEVARVRFFCADDHMGKFPPKDLTIVSSGEIRMFFGRCCRGDSSRRVFSIQPGVSLSRRFPSGKFWVASYCLPLPGNFFGHEYEVVKCTCYRKDRHRGFIPCNEVVFGAYIKSYQKAIEVCGRRILDQLPTELKAELFQGFF